MSSVIRQEGESQNECFKKIEHVKFSEKQTFFYAVRTCAYQGVKNVRFSENLRCLVFLEHPFWDSPFCLITDGISMEKIYNITWCIDDILINWYIDQLINWSIDQSRYIDDQRILKSDWTRAFWPITYEPKFSQIWGFHKKIENYKIFPSRLLPAKSNNRILENPIFASFRKNMNFMSTLSLYVSLISCAITWKANRRKLK